MIGTDGLHLTCVTGKMRASIDPHRKVSTMKVACTLLILAGSSAMMLAQPGAPYLSHLQATASSPLYTTYAAAMERSEFTLDEGYHFASL